MFELTNEQRKHFGLQPVESDWVRIEPMNSPAWCTTIAYIDGTVIRKYIETGDSVYTEYEVSEQLSDDLRYLQPKTNKGKPVLLSASTLRKRTGFGMRLTFIQHNPDLPASIMLYNLTAQRIYYISEYEPVYAYNISGFQQWVENWCAASMQDDLEDIARFVHQPKQHVKYREGDVFRFKINRYLYGYGRVLLDYSLMRKKKIPFWDVFIGKPVVCSVYHIVTERDDVTLQELEHLNSLPSVHMMDNDLFYGTLEIIGHIPIREQEDYPIMYGSSIDVRYRAELLQCGKLYLKNDDASALFHDFTNHGVSFGLNFNLSVLLECIESNSNAPYWNQNNRKVNKDLRNPKFRSQLEQVCKQFNIPPSHLIK